jgi:hydroxypyruvate isomerase
VYQLSPNIELLFTEAGTDYADRVGAAAAAGFDAVEMWGTLDQNIGSLRQLASLHDSGYAGPLGLEYFPTVESIASVAYLRGIA